MAQMRKNSGASALSSKSILSDRKLSEQIDEKSEKSESSSDEKETERENDKKKEKEKNKETKKDKDKENKENKENKDYSNLKISQESQFDYIGFGLISNGATPQFRILGNEKAILDNLQKLLERIRKRKTKLIDQRKSNRERIKKLKQD